MRYALLPKAHPNEHYRQARKKLSMAELRCCLNAHGYTNSLPEYTQIQSNDFLCFSVPDRDPDLLREISGLSFVALAAELIGEDSLRPLPPCTGSIVPEELPHVLKYKGKTNADFTLMMLRCAEYLSDYRRSSERLSLIDPMCGKATTLFCGSVAGMDTWGLDVNRKELEEADRYLEKSLQMHRISYERREESRKLRSRSGGVKSTEYCIHKRERSGLRLALTECNLRDAPELFRPGSFHLLVCDMPYGVQHAPKAASLSRTGEELMKVAGYLLKKGGALGVSFNEKTLSQKQLLQSARNAELIPVEDGFMSDLSHYVEQAIVRNVVFAVNR